MGREFVKQIDNRQMVDSIWAVARREERLKELADECETPVVAVQCDLTSEDDIKESIAARITAEQHEVSLLINCAGFAKFGGFDEITAKDVAGMIALNISALVKMIEMCVPHMKPGGRIVNIASTAAFQPLPDMNVYAATKAFVLSYSRALNRELGEKDISVTAVCPGWTKTEFFDVARENADNNAMKSFTFMMKPEAVVKSALNAAQKRSEVCVPGLFNKFHLFFSKILPDSSIMTIWEAFK